MSKDSRKLYMCLFVILPRIQSCISTRSILCNNNNNNTLYYSVKSSLIPHAINYISIISDGYLIVFFLIMFFGVCVCVCVCWGGGCIRDRFILFYCEDFKLVVIMIVHLVLSSFFSNSKGKSWYKCDGRICIHNTILNFIFGMCFSLCRAPNNVQKTCLTL